MCRTPIKCPLMKYLASYSSTRWWPFTQSATSPARGCPLPHDFGWVESSDYIREFLFPPVGGWSHTMSLRLMLIKSLPMSLNSETFWANKMKEMVNLMTILYICNIVELAVQPSNHIIIIITGCTTGIHFGSHIHAQRYWPHFIFMKKIMKRWLTIW